ncbi:hypothetical protein FOQG_19120 [Fusarium oxysporum f. sp. raphani 54005]|uniref:Uncharacterized protein n=1 Tax=Fusarium oxysporum f. sp. raphani 54005 TaxID=1089458 RepID=X0BC92_FUSOX|nr:hypothetical protein FOQG_19229 [Fusarium oxysporum f. sp. raphani 54005]EXK76119.1 hypothetical protein FOQG_19120 [Fusarium oxysporum f. sp. raphani 54005]
MNAPLKTILVLRAGIAPRTATRVDRFPLKPKLLYVPFGT